MNEPLIEITSCFYFDGTFIFNSYRQYSICVCVQKGKVKSIVRSDVEGDRYRERGTQRSIIMKRTFWISYFDVFVVCWLTLRTFSTLWFIQCKKHSRPGRVNVSVKFAWITTENKRIRELHQYKKIYRMNGHIHIPIQTLPMINYARPAEQTRFVIRAREIVMWKTKRKIHPWPYILDSICSDHLSPCLRPSSYACIFTQCMLSFGLLFANWQRLKHHWKLVLFLGF